MGKDVADQTANRELAQSLDRLKEESNDLKRKIVEEKRRHDMPIDSNLGDPAFEERAKDGHLDRPDEDED
jgi:hypothetical protein